VKETEVNLGDEGFEEVTGEEKQDPKPETGNLKPGTGGPAPGGNRPDFRVVQTDRDKEGKSVYVNVGGMWKNVSKQGNEFYTLKIGQLKLLVFANANKFDKQTEQ
jgi:hypothetical protein